LITAEGRVSPTEWISTPTHPFFPQEMSHHHHLTDVGDDDQLDDSHDPIMIWSQRGSSNSNSNNDNRQRSGTSGLGVNSKRDYASTVGGIMAFLHGTISIKALLVLFALILVVWRSDHNSTHDLLTQQHSQLQLSLNTQTTLADSKSALDKQLHEAQTNIESLKAQLTAATAAAGEALQHLEKTLESTQQQFSESLVALNTSNWEQQKLSIALAAATAVVVSPVTSLRILVLYAYFKSGNSEPNLKYFLKAGVLPYANDSRVQFVIASSSSLDGIPFPQVSNLAILMRRNEGMDFCGWRQAIDAIKELTNGSATGVYSYDRIILINGSIRGPFMPSLAGDRWIEVFISPLAHCGPTPAPDQDGKLNYTGTCEIGLVGSSINCHKLNNQRRRFMALHVQSMLLAFTTAHWSLLENNINCWEDGSHVWFHGEVGLTWAALRNNLNLAVTSQLFRGTHHISMHISSLSLCEST
jgi:hypothetical protein